MVHRALDRVSQCVSADGAGDRNVKRLTAEHAERADAVLLVLFNAHRRNE